MPMKKVTVKEYDSQDEASTELLEKLKHLDRRVDAAEGGGLAKGTAGGRRSTACWQSMKWKSALNHIGLLVSLSIYCGVGGLVSDGGGQRVCPVRCPADPNITRQIFNYFQYVFIYLFLFFHPPLPLACLLRLPRTCKMICVVGPKAEKWLAFKLFGARKKCKTHINTVANRAGDLTWPKKKIFNIPLMHF